MRKLKTQIDDEEPEDLGIKVGSEAEVFWTNAKTKLEAESKKAAYEIEIDEHVIKLCDERILEEQKKRSNA